MIKNLPIILLLVMAALQANAQQLTGEVADALSGELLIGATVSLLDGSEVAITDSKGLFSLKGTGVVKVSYIGYETLQITSGAGFVAIKLTPNQTQMQMVEIVGRKAQDYNSAYSFSATKIATANKDIPQSISTVTKELITDRQAFRLGDVLKNVSGVSTVSFYNHYAIRGVTQNSSSIENRLINGMRTSQIYFNQPLSSNVERVEVIKGPSSMTFSNTDAGGSINIVTKKPLAEARSSVGLTVGSFNTMRAAVDFTGPLNQGKTLLYRVNIGY
nr:TonB-dependent receptor plug domain-containing protein [Cytophagales bacterium]